MFPITYEDWQNVCSQTLINKRSRKQAFLQWYPFAGLSRAEKDLLISKTFYEDYIGTGFFVYLTDTWHISDNYLMKGDGTFRHSSLVSPILYLVVLAIGRNFALKYISNRPSNVDVFYAGNFVEGRLTYHKDYDEFHKRLNELAGGYQYFIKTDIRDFFPNISLNRLFDVINEKFVSAGIQLPQKEMFFTKELLLTLGKGEFPLLDNSTTTSFLSTVFYLEDADTVLSNYISTFEKDISASHMVRYVDDLYILFSVRQGVNLDALPSITNRILDCYIDVLKKGNLALNRGKTVSKPIANINEELKKSLYDEYVRGKSFSIADFVNGDNLVAFLSDIDDYQRDYSLDYQKYDALIDKHFSVDDIESSPKENYNAVLYERHQLLSDKTIESKLMGIISNSYAFMKLDVKRFLTLILKTKSERLIKKFLNCLFQSHKRGTWNIFDTSLAAQYLLQRKFVHRDLLTIIGVEACELSTYISRYCKRSFAKGLISEEETKQTFLNTIFHKADDKLFMLYFLYKAELLKGNYLSAFAYYKNFFDRISAHIGKVADGNSKPSKPNYKGYYKEGALKTLYADCHDCESIIAMAHSLRNSNPISHASAELIDNNSSSAEIVNIIERLEKMISEKIELLIVANS